jgi:hypothetical protein
MSEWISEEFKDLDLGDKRLVDRFINVMSAFDLKPEGCINRIFKDEGSSRKAAYRLFENKKFKTAKILECHTEMTSERMIDEDVVLSLHDSSYFSYNTKPSIEGLGNIGGSLGVNDDGEDAETKGFIGHFALAVTTKGLPLGLQAVKCWSRDNELPWDKESERWVELLEVAEKTYSKKTQLVFIADREADQFQLLFDVKNRGHDFIIRSKYDRLIKGEDHYISWHMKKSKKIFDSEIELTKPKKKVAVEIKFGEVIINDTDKITNKKYGDYGVRDVTVGVVEVVEKVKREGEEKLRWVLLTNLPLETKEDAERVINYYKMRWQIENYFKVLKDGCCHVEHASLRSFEKLERYTMCFSIIAWRLFWLKFINHIDPELPAKSILTDLEIEVLKVRHKDKIDKRTLTAGAAIKLIAMMGGYNNRKTDGPPGNITLWRGFLIIRDRAQYHEELLQTHTIKRRK